MTKTSRIRRTFAAVVGLALAGSVTAAAGAGPASAADDHLTSAVLLSAKDFARAGWVDPFTFPEVSADELLTQESSDPVFGTEVVMAFRTDADAKQYAADYAFSVGVVCPATYGSKRWDVRWKAKPHLAQRHQLAQTWLVRDTTGVPQTVSITLLRDHERVALIWLTGAKREDPSRFLALRDLAQRATDRMEA
jgi:hypothetical protein